MGDVVSQRSENYQLIIWYNNGDIARSSNGRTADSGSAYRGSSPCWAALHS